MTFRSPNRVVELEGINYVRGVVQSHQSIYHEIAGGNDQGNDGYIEFVLNNYATNFGVFVQVKSGKSYKNKNDYIIPANNDHLKYWSNGLYPVVGIVYDPDLKKAFWIDISEYASHHPDCLNEDNHTIPVSTEREFSSITFNSFVNHFTRLIQQYKNFENYGKSLDFFARVDEPQVCYEGLKSLYANHRDKQSAWHYIISNFGKIREEGIHRNILGLLSNYAANPHIFWNSNNITYYPPIQIKELIAKLLSTHFGEHEIKIALPYMREGINRGSFSFSVFLVIDMVENVDQILKKVAFDKAMEVGDRIFCFWLYLHLAQRNPSEDVLADIEAFFKDSPEAREDEAIAGMKESILAREYLPIG